jgi:hypothetical protein
MMIIAKEVAFTNDVGGTSLMEGRFKVRVDASYVDDEIGTVLHGRLVDATDIARARREGTTGYGPEDYKKYGPDLVEQTRKARNTFDPARVHVSYFDVIK